MGGGRSLKNPSHVAPIFDSHFRRFSIADAWVGGPGGSFVPLSFPAPPSRLAFVKLARDSPPKAESTFAISYIQQSVPGYRTHIGESSKKSLLFLFQTTGHFPPPGPNLFPPSVLQHLSRSKWLLQEKEEGKKMEEEGINRRRKQFRPKLFLLLSI